MHSWTLPPLTLPALERFAGLLALYVQSGDLVLFNGDLGAGKTTFARAFIRALAGDPGLEVPSPTFALLQSYATPRLTVHHFDLYRLDGPRDVREIGFEEALASGLTLIEWPDRAGDLLPAERLDIHLSDGPDADRRCARLTGHLGWAARLQHIELIHGFLERSGAGDATLRHLAGDASRRSYARLAGPTGPCLLMDSPPLAGTPLVKDGKPYWEIARSSRDVGDFVTVATWLDEAGLSVPAILAQDLDAGLLLIEDFGDRTFEAAMASGEPMATLYQAATDVLLELSARPVPAALKAYDKCPLLIEASLVLDWYWPEIVGGTPGAAAREQFEQLWSAALQPILSEPAAWVLRDVHSPNLIWLPDRNGRRKVGVIDFQDALAGHAAYDLASLLQDARLDVPAALETAMLDYYVAQRRLRDASFDKVAFERAYATLGAQRNTKILGIFARLARRDGKPGYLKHLPRIRSYLARDLAHPALAGLRDWFSAHLPV
jgi:N-acetylmuramate 1-kinase